MTDVWIESETALQLGQEWIQAVREKDFARLSEICQPNVYSQLTTPSRIQTLESASDLAQKVELWFGACDPIRQEHSRVAMVGEKLGIFYRLSVQKHGEPFTIEQQLYCTLHDGRIAQIHLLCSGFQPVTMSFQAPLTQPAEASLPLKADALLTVDTGGGSESTCALLTPLIKQKLKEINSGQVLEVRVDDPDAGGDIEAWCRLSGNTLLSLDRQEGQVLRFTLMKK